MVCPAKCTELTLPKDSALVLLARRAGVATGMRLSIKWIKWWTHQSGLNRDSLATVVVSLLGLIL